MNKKLLISLLILCCTIALSREGITVDRFDIYGYVETIDSKELTLLFYDRPSEDEYLIIDSEVIIGRVNIRDIMIFRRGDYSYRATGGFILNDPRNAALLKAGAKAALRSDIHQRKEDYSHEYFRELLRYKEEIVSVKDNRRMVLVPEGRFIMGSNTGDHDEGPEHEVFVDNFYIDIYEVSNSDYYRYITAANVSPPDSWGGEKYPEGEGNLPVLVTYYEAAAYAEWNGKRLPTEAEWEKAARGENPYRGALYPWGREFNPRYANSAEYWRYLEKSDPERLSETRSGPLPVDSFGNIGSPYGARNLAGNVREWTSSWYQPYPGNHRENNKFGEQYKVIRGGSWLSPGDQLRVTNRETGGTPSLRTDNRAGFRCVKAPERRHRQ